LLLGAGTGTVRRLPPGSERMLAAALLAGAVAYGVHALYDWDWNFPSLTLPALVFLGVLAGARGRARPLRVELPGPGPGARALALAASTLTLGLIAVCAALPSLAHTHARSALVGASSSSQAGLRSAIASAELATRLDPLSDEGLKVAATIEWHRNRLTSARDDFLKAVRKVPTDAQAWTQLADIELLLGDTRGLTRAADRALALDPRSAAAQSLAEQANGFVAPPSESASATGTPLPAG
jgi:hypothetical protein